MSNQDSGVTGAAKFVTSTGGSLVGGLVGTLGGVTGAAARGVGSTLNATTGSLGKPVGDALISTGDGVESGTKDVAKGVQNAGEWKGTGTGKRL